MASRSDGSKATTVRLDVTLPADAAAATQRIDVVATAGGAIDRLPLDIRVTPTAAGEVSLTTDFPELKGTSTTAFTFNLTLHNDTAEDLTFGGTATGPPGWTVTAQVSSESQAASAIVKAGSHDSGHRQGHAVRRCHRGLVPDHRRCHQRQPERPCRPQRRGHRRLHHQAHDAGRAPEHIGVGRLGVRPDAHDPEHGHRARHRRGAVRDRPQGWTVKFDPETVDVAPAG